MSSSNINKVAADLLKESGGGNKFDLQRIYGGANNKVFRVITNNHNFLLKVYFKDSRDPRYRLKNEFSFCKFAWENGIRSLPQPMACDFRNQAALYEFIKGRHLNANDVTRQSVICALNFYQELNKHKDDRCAQRLATASEACFSIAEHIRCVEGRFDMLKNIKKTSEVNLLALNFVKGELSRSWLQARDFIIDKAKRCNLALHKKIRDDDKCLSPSDFGFHNAILNNDGKLCFIDFEYAGWDDPAKMVCDFFSQPKVPVPLSYFDMFIRKVISALPQPKKTMQRISILFPLYQLKWCCILLNDFLPVHSRRRSFSFGAKSSDRFKAGQLHKARRYLENFNKGKFIKMRTING